MSKTYTVIAEGEKACSLHPPISEGEVTILTQDIEFRGQVTNTSETSVSVRGFRNVVKKSRGKYIDVRTPFVLHFSRGDIIDPRKGSFSGGRIG